MKFMHLGDLHFGKALAEFNLEEDQRFITKQIIELAKDNEVDGLLIAGDVYDRANPGDGAMNLLNDFLRDAESAGLKVLLISGNHDSDDKLNFGSSFFESHGIYIYSSFDGTMHKVTLQDTHGLVNIYLLPFVKASQVRDYYETDEPIATYEQAVQTILKHTEINKGERNLLIAHQFVTGNGSEGQTDPVLSGSENPATLHVGNVERIHYDLFADFDYVALGHIHSPQWVGKDTVRYSGSPLKYSISEENDHKSVPLITLGEKGDVQIELLPLKPMRELRHIKGTKEELLSDKYRKFAEDFLHITLTEETVITDAINIFRGFYPNVLRLDYENSHTKALKHADVNLEAVKAKSFENLIGDFYWSTYREEISEEELSFIKEIASRAGVRISEGT